MPSVANIKLNSVIIKLAATFIVSIVLVSTVIAFFSFSSARQAQDDRLRAQALNTNKLLTISLTQAIRLNNRDEVQQILADMITEEGAAVFGLAVNSSGETIGQFGRDTRATGKALQAARNAVNSSETELSNDGYSVAHPIVDIRTGTAIGSVATTWAPDFQLQKDVDNQATTLKAGAGALLVVLLGTILLMQRMVARPLAHLRLSMDEVSQANYDVEIPAGRRRDEIGAMAHALENLRCTLQSGHRETRDNRFKGTAFEASTASMMLATTDMIISAANPALVASLHQHKCEFEKTSPGFDPEAIVGKSMVFHLAPSTQEQVKNALKDPQNLPFHDNISIGDSRFKLSIGMVRDENEGPIGYVIELTDDTAQYLNDALLNAIDVNQVKAEFSMAGKLLDANDGFVKMRGEDKQQLLGREMSKVFQFNSELTNQNGTVLQQLGANETVFGRFEVLRENDAPAILEGGFSPVEDGSGKAIRIIFIGNDVTKADQAIKSAEAEREDMQKAQSHVVEALRVGLGQLSEGNLEAEIHQPFGPEYEQLRLDFNEATDKLLDAVGQVIENTDQIRDEVSEISNAAEDLSQRTETQAASLEETASALDQLTSSVRSAADGASHASEIVDGARQNAEASGEVVREAVVAMSEIEKSSKQISTITNVIGDIAFQTNLLALNAGVEAARAGEAGRGFAVVASEVRALAQRSSEAANEINDLILASDGQVQRGVKLVDRTGTALEEIVESVCEISQSVSEIAVSAREQSSGLEEINTAVNQLDQVTQQNAAMFEETTAASHALTQKTEDLQKTMKRFSIGADRRSEPRAPVPHQPEAKIRPAQKAVVNEAAPVVPSLAPAPLDQGWEEF